MPMAFVEFTLAGIEQVVAILPTQVGVVQSAGDDPPLTSLTISGQQLIVDGSYADTLAALAAGL